MSKLVVLKIDNGNFADGFNVTLSIGEENLQPFIQKIGQLPPNNKIINLYEKWVELYKIGISNSFPRVVIKNNQITNFSYQEIKANAESLKNQLNSWLNSDHFQPIKYTLLANLSRSDEIRFLFQTENAELHKLPWHLWDFLQYYEKAEIALSFSEYQKSALSNSRKFINRVRILVIFGDSSNLSFYEEEFLLRKLFDAEIIILVEPSRLTLSNYLWKQGFDIIFFAGHSRTEKENGYLFINRNEMLTIDDLKFSFEKTVENGLKLVILNSCEGFGLANDLAKLNIPQIVVMRELIPNIVAQIFLRYFLESFTSGKSLYVSVRESRQRLEAIEDRFPSVSWLPVIFQHPAHIPPTWSELRGKIINNNYSFSYVAKQTLNFFKKAIHQARFSKNTGAETYLSVSFAFEECLVDFLEKHKNSLQAKESKRRWELFWFTLCDIIALTKGLISIAFIELFSSKSARK